MPHVCKIAPRSWSRSGKNLAAGGGRNPFTSSRRILDIKAGRCTEKTPKQSRFLFIVVVDSDVRMKSVNASRIKAEEML